MTRLSRTFGFQSVEEQEREQRIRRVFVAVARRYDLMNDLMSMGIHRLWKRTLVRLAAPRAGQCIVDLAGGTGENMPLASASVDTVTIAFGIRNVTRIEDALTEALRVLKPGGRFLCLEFSTPWAPVRPFYNFFSFAVIPRLGALVAQAPEAYTYLVESIRRFPDQRSFKALMEQAGFADVTYRNLSFGIACIHVGSKPAAAARGGGA